MKKKIIAILSGLTIALSFTPSFNVYAESTKVEKSEAKSDELPTGEALDEAKSLEVIKKVNEAMSKVKNFELSGSVETGFQGQVIKGNMKGIVDMEKELSQITTDVMGMSMQVFIKDNKTFVQDPVTNEWQYTKLEGAGVKDSYNIAEDGIKYLLVEKISDGYVVKTKDDLSLEEFTKVFKSNQSFQGMEQMGENAKIKSKLAYIVDKDFKIKEQRVESKVTTSIQGSEMEVVMNMVSEFSNYDKAPKIELPEDLDKAKETSAPSSQP